MGIGDLWYHGLISQWSLIKYGLFIILFFLLQTREHFSYKTPHSLHPSWSSYKGQVTFARKKNMAEKMKRYGLHHVKLCKYCSSVADVINNALQRVIAWRKSILIGVLISPFVRVRPPSSLNPLSTELDRASSSKFSWIWNAVVAVDISE